MKSRPYLFRHGLYLFVACSCLFQGARILRAAENEASFGIETRVAWTTSRLVGSPDPPLPYTVEKRFTQLPWKEPIFLVPEPQSDYLWMVKRGGGASNPALVQRFRNDQDATDFELLLEVPEQLVYSVCFDPGYATNRWIYLFGNGPLGNPERTNRIVRYTVEPGPPPRIDPKSEEVLIEWKSTGHDGGDMVFGLDGMFYVTTGDGTSDSDIWNSGQTIDDLLGAVLRIDVHHRDGQRPYTIPADNPFVSMPGARGEIWAYGLRNPWRMCVDPKSGRIWVGNNGQDLWETAHLIGRGENYGWSVYEGSHPFYLERKLGPTPHVPPTIEHSHAEFRALTGGVVYYGDQLPELNGAYIYGDYSSGRIWGMKHDGQKVLWHRELADTTLQLVAFQVDPHGELLMADLVGGVYRLIPAPPSEPHAPFPVRLSETGLFASTAEHRVDAGLIPYSVNAAGWTDGAQGERFIGLPGQTQITYHADRSWVMPEGTSLMETLSLEREPGNAASRFRIETRVLLLQQGEWAGYSYRWNEDQTDALLVEKEGAETQWPLSASSGDDSEKQTWRFPSRSDCMMCHSRAANFVLGLTEAQLNREHDYGSTRDNQLRTLDHLGVFNSALTKPPQAAARLTDPYDTTQELETRARAYLQVNCSVCHVMAGGGNSQMELVATIPREKMNLLSARPQHDTFGINDAMLVAPSDPQRSVLIHRLDRRGRGQMPPLVSMRKDERAIELMRQWITQLKPDKPFVRHWEITHLQDALAEAHAGRSLEAGKKVFRETGCIQCHRFGSDGGTVGPDLTNVAKRTTPQEMLESILLPSKKIADEFAIFVIETSDGEIVSGRVEREDADVLVLRATSAADPPMEIPKKEILVRNRSNLSNMPMGIVNVLQKDEILDLLSYLRFGPDLPAVAVNVADIKDADPKVPDKALSKPAEPAVPCSSCMKLRRFSSKGDCARGSRPKWRRHEALRDSGKP